MLQTNRPIVTKESPANLDAWLSDQLLLAKFTPSSIRLFKGVSINIINGGNGWFIRENPKQKMDDLGISLIIGNLHIHKNLPKKVS